MVLDTTIINQLYLELSQVASASTEKELDMISFFKHIESELRQVEILADELGPVDISTKIQNLRRAIDENLQAFQSRRPYQNSQEPGQYLYGLSFGKKSPERAFGSN